MVEKEHLKFESSNLFEGMTSISALINHYQDNGRRIKVVYVDRTKQKPKAAELGFLRAKSKELGFSLELVDSEVLDSLTVGTTHGGIVASCTDRSLPSLSTAELKKDGFYVFLEGIEDPYNFGYTIRSLYAAGVDGIVLPPRNWMSAAGVVARASAGTSEMIPMFVSPTEEVCEYFHKLDYRILCAGIRDSVSIFDSDQNFDFPILLVIGGEKRGISRNVLNSADTIIRIDYGRPFRGSLCSSAAAAVLAFSLLERKNKRKVNPV